MTGPKQGWNDNNYEGKALRRIFTKLLKRFEKEIQNEDTDIDKLQKIAHTLTLVAREKGILAKEHNDLLRKIKELESKLPKDIPIGTIIIGAQENARELPSIRN
jgi:hypothetical protein